MNVKYAVLLFAALPCVAFAAEPRYTYVEGGYQFVEFDDLNVDGDGIGLRGSFGVTDRVHLMAEYADLGLDLGIDSTTIQVGVGGNWAASDAFHLVAEGGYADVEVETPFGDASDDGFFLSTGFRWMALERMELRSEVEYVDLSESGDDTALVLGMRYFFTPALALSVAADVADDSTGYTAGVQYYFR